MMTKTVQYFLKDFRTLQVLLLVSFGLSTFVVSLDAEARSRRCNREINGLNYCYTLYESRRSRGQIRRTPRARYCRTRIQRVRRYCGDSVRVAGEEAPRVTPRNPEDFRGNLSTLQISGNPSTRSCRDPRNTQQCLLCNCQNEGGSRETRVNLTRTVLSRVSSTSHPNSICGVIRTRSQFSWFNPFYGRSSINGSWRDGRRALTAESIRSCTEAVNEALRLGPNNACNYHTISTGHYMRRYPSWARQYRVAFRDSVHVFYESCGQMQQITEIDAGRDNGTGTVR